MVILILTCLGAAILDQVYKGVYSLAYSLALVAKLILERLQPVADRL